MGQYGRSGEEGRLAARPRSCTLRIMSSKAPAKAPRAAARDKKAEREERERRAVEKAADLFKKMYGPAIEELEKQ